MDILSFLMLGIGFGFLHALEPDHLVGIASISTSTKDKLVAFRRGAIWGLGHTATILILYLIFKGLGLVLEDALFEKLESLVGLLLIFLGIRIFYKLFKDKYHLHSHEHETGDAHLHLHSHKAENSHDHIHLPFGIGIIHGLAGSGAIILALAIRSSTQIEGILYILFFGLGSCVAMGIFSGFLMNSISIIGEWMDNSGRVFATSLVIIGFVSCLLGFKIIRDSGVF